MSIRSLYVLVVLGILLQYPASAQSYTLTNDATMLSGSSCYQLTSDSAGDQGGGVYQNDPINLDSSFDYKCCLFMGCNGNSSGDGICFILSNNISGIGANNGAGLG